MSRTEDTLRAELEGILHGVEVDDRISAAGTIVGQLSAVLAAIENGEIEASATETARIEGAVIALSIIAN